MERIVRDDDRGARAVIRYRPRVYQSGQVEIVNDDGTGSHPYWHGFSGQFAAEVIEGRLAEDDADAFLRESVIAVYPSVEREWLETGWVSIRQHHYLVHAQCPEVDEKLD